MFDKKVDSLIDTTNKEKVKKFNAFVETAFKASNETLSGNGALKYITTGNELVDDFASASMYKNPRTYQEVDKTMRLLWIIDPLSTLKLSLYFRGITRICKDDKGTSTESPQRGQGLKNEGILRFMWIAINHPDVFKANIALYLMWASYKDLFVMLSMDLQYNGWANRKLDWNFFYLVIVSGLSNPNVTNLIRKYLPTIKTNSKCTTLESQAHTLIGRWIASRMYGKGEVTAYKEYRKTKSAGIAHEWQQKISKQLYDKINFNTIAGRALAQLVGSKFLENHNLTDKYNKWISNKSTAKFTGFVFELFKPLDGYINSAPTLPAYKEKTIEAQFNQLVKTGKGNADTQSKLLVVRDTSGSMSAITPGTGMTANGIAKSLALYFSEFLKGEFKGAYAEFSDECVLKKWQGNTVCDKWRADTSEAYGSTEFCSVAKLLASIKDRGVAEKDFPTGILCLSDGEFNKSNYSHTTNITEFRQILTRAGFSQFFIDNFKIILWDIPDVYYDSNRTVKFEDFADAPNLFHISGFDGSIIAFLMGKGELKLSPKNSEELLEAALNQELLNRLTIPQRKSFHKNKPIKKKSNCHK